MKKRSLFSRRDAAGFLTARTVSLNLRPEQSNNFEFGVGTTAYDVAGLTNTVSAKAMVFYNDVTDMIASGTVANGPYYVNINKARLYGFELEGSYESDTLYGPGGG